MSNFKTLTDQTINSNYTFYLTKLEKTGVNIEQFKAVFGDLLPKASFSVSNEIGAAFDGSLIEIVLKILTPYAVKLNDLLPESSRVDKTSIVKVCLLHHISKAFRFIKNDNEWEVKNRQMVYKYNPNIPLSVGFGSHSLHLLTDMGVKFTPQEFEAMTIMERSNDDKQAKFYSSTLSNIVRMANELTYLHLRNQDNTTV